MYVCIKTNIYKAKHKAKYKALNSGNRHKL